MTRRRHLGVLDLVLVAVVVAAMWTRTPVGGLAQYAVGAVLGWDADAPALTAYFLTGEPVRVDHVPLVAAPAADPLPPGAFPEPLRTAARSLDVDLGVLDELYVGDAEAALEVAAVGAEQRDRAIARARATGSAAPERYDEHRRFLPARAARRADRIVTTTLGLATVLDLRWPLPRAAPITSPYGPRKSPITGLRSFHRAVDLAAATGTPVSAVQAGTVVVAKRGGGCGVHAVVDHGHGVRSTYCHLDRLDVGVGDALDAGEVLGRSGSTGNVTGPHLHLALRLGRQHIDPEPLLTRPPPSS